MIRLAQVRELEFRGFTVIFPRGSILAANADLCRNLYCFEPVEEYDTDEEPSPEAVKGFETFHGRFPRFVSEIVVPDDWEKIGTVKTVLYLSSKLNGGGNGLPQLFRHKFEPGTTAYRSRHSPSWIRVFRNDLYIDERGIVN